MKPKQIVVYYRDKGTIVDIPEPPSDSFLDGLTILAIYNKIETLLDMRRRRDYVLRIMEMLCQ